MVALLNDFSGKLIGSYRIDTLIGIGGSGAVFLAHTEDDESHQVAMKILIPPLIVKAEVLKEFNERFKREAQILAQLDHPHILPVISFDTDEELGCPYMVLPYKSAGTLTERIEAGPLTFEQVLHYVRQIASALDYAHSRDIVHRDIKPANVLLDENDQAYLADFSVAKLFATTTTTLTAAQHMLGTPAYMAPEQVNNAKVSAATDVYGLGILTYQLMTGKLPFDTPELMLMIQHILKDIPPDPCELCVSMQRSSADVILRALEKDPTERFTSAGAFAQALEQSLQDSLATLISHRDQSTQEIVEDQEKSAPRLVAIGVSEQNHSTHDEEAPVVSQALPIEVIPDAPTEMVVSTEMADAVVLPPTVPAAPLELVPTEVAELQESNLDVVEMADPAVLPPTLPAAPLELTSTEVAEPQESGLGVVQAESKPEAAEPSEDGLAPTIYPSDAAPPEPDDPPEIVSGQYEPATQPAFELLERTHFALTTAHQRTALVKRSNASRKSGWQMVAIFAVFLVFIVSGLVYDYDLINARQPASNMHTLHTVQQNRVAKLLSTRPAATATPMPAPTSPPPTPTPVPLAPPAPAPVIQQAPPAPVNYNPGASSATITITPESQNEQSVMSVSAVTGSPGQGQSQARLLTNTSQGSSATVNATGQGTTPATFAAGSITFTNTTMLSTLQIPAGTFFPSFEWSSAFVIDASVNLPPAPASADTDNSLRPSQTVSAHAAIAGSSGNTAYEYEPSLCGSEQTVCYHAESTGNFTGGMDAQPYTFVQQADIDAATNQLGSSGSTPNAMQTLQGQMQANEQWAGTPSCQPKMSADHAVNDTAATVTVSLSYVCSGEVYDQNGAIQTGKQLFMSQVGGNLDAGYSLQGSVTATIQGAQAPDASGTVVIAVAASGTWTYQFSQDQERQLATRLAGQSTANVQTLLQSLKGIKQVSVQLQGNQGEFPTDPGKITIVIKGS